MLAVWRIRTHLSCWKKWRWQLLCALASTVAWRFWPKPSWNKGTDISSLLRKFRASREIVSCQMWEPCLAKSRRGRDELICWWASALRFSFFLPDFGEEASKSHMAFAASIAELISAPGWPWSWWCMVPHGAGVHFGRTDVAWGLEVSMAFQPEGMKNRLLLVCWGGRNFQAIVVFSVSENGGMGDWAARFPCYLLKKGLT